MKILYGEVNFALPPKSTLQTKGKPFLAIALKIPPQIQPHIKRKRPPSWYAGAEKVQKNLSEWDIRELEN